MGYKKETWSDRIAQRIDTSSQVVHLTRERQDAGVAQVMYEIVASRKLKGSSTQSGFICGKTPAVCFQDAPLVSVCQTVYYEQKYQEQSKSKTRYRACVLRRLGDPSVHQRQLLLREEVVASSCRGPRPVGGSVPPPLVHPASLPLATMAACRFRCQAVPPEPTARAGTAFTTRGRAGAIRVWLTADTEAFAVARRAPRRAARTGCARQESMTTTGRRRRWCARGSQ
jgi:hypothetical protein